MTTHDDNLSAGEPAASQAVAQPGACPTEEMVTAYLTANDAYWKRIDAEPTTLGKWRNGTPSEATRVSLAAALAAAPPKGEIEQLRAQQAAEVMPNIGALLDAWDGMPNDFKSYVKEGAPDLARAMSAINAAMEGQGESATQATKPAATRHIETVLRAERDHARARLERAVSILSGIHCLLDPPPFQANGKTFIFKNPAAQEILHGLSVRIRAIPDEIDRLASTPRERLAQAAAPAQRIAGPV